MLGLHSIDILVIAAYLLSLVAIGFATARSVRNTGDFFVGGRRFGKIMMALLGFGTSTHADNMVAVIIMMSVNALVGWPVHPQRFSVVGAAKTDWDVRMGALIGTLVKRIGTVAWAFSGLCILALLPGLDNPDHAFGEGAQLLLPAGLVGLFLASVIASVQSSCDTFMVAASGIFTRNIFSVYFVKKAPDSYYLTVGRISSLVIVAGSILFALCLPGVPHALELFWKVTALMGLPFWLGVAWRRANPAAVWASFTVAGAVFLACEFDTLTGFTVTLPWQMLSYIVAGLISGLIAGYLTKPQPKEQLDRFFRDLHTPVDTVELLKSDTMYHFPGRRLQ